MPMRAPEVIRILLDFGCVEVRQVGSHRRFTSPNGQCHTTVPMHKGQDIGTDLLHRIERQMAPCLGKKWLTQR
jgi:predicted RNA binding protein YcfA (HicA-like mRNA interferase family)